MLHGYPVYVVRQIRANERHLVEEQLKEAKRRILWQQMYDGFFTYRHYGIALSDGSFVHFRGNINFIQIDACIICSRHRRLLRHGYLRKIYPPPEKS